MSDAGVEKGPEEAMEEAEAAEQAAMTEVRAAAATAMEAAQAAATNMANLAQAVDRWQQASATASKKRREANRQSASLVKQMHIRIQEMEKLMEERTGGLPMTFSKEKKKLSNVADEKPPRSLSVDDRQGTTTPERKTKLVGAKRSGQSSEVRSATPSKHQRTLESDGALKAPFPDSATQPTSYVSPILPPSTSVLRQQRLLSAVKYGRMDDVVNYLQLGVDPNFRDEEGNTLLHVAAKSARGRILKVLLAVDRVQVDAVDSAGQTALHVAAASAKGGTCVNTILKHKADVNKRDEKGDTPLHCAARNGHELIVKKLLLKGAVSMIANNDGEIPIQVANTDGVREMLQSQIWTSLPVRESLNPASFVSTSVGSESEINEENQEIYLD